MYLKRHIIKAYHRTLKMTVVPLREQWQKINNSQDLSGFPTLLEKCSYLFFIVQTVYHQGHVYCAFS